MHEAGGFDGHGAGSGPYGHSKQQQEGQQGGQRLLSRLGLHLSMAALMASVWWFYLQDFPAIQRKLVFTFLFPVGKVARFSIRHGRAGMAGYCSSYKAAAKVL
jgi:hypothetical protein